MSSDYYAGPPEPFQPYLCVLLQHHLVQNGHEPVLKLAVIIIWHQQVPNPRDGSGVSRGHRDPQPSFPAPTSAQSLTC